MQEEKKKIIDLEDEELNKALQMSGIKDSTDNNKKLKPLFSKNKKASLKNKVL